MFASLQYKLFPPLSGKMKQNFFGLDLIIKLNVSFWGHHKVKETFTNSHRRIISILSSNSQGSLYDVVSHSAPSVYVDPVQASFLGVHWSKEKEPNLNGTFPSARLLTRSFAFRLILLHAKSTKINKKSL